jgi:dihydroneopterin aldolase
MGFIRRQVALRDVRFYAYHGFYPEEQVIGAVFYVDVETEFEQADSSEDELGNTINYEELFNIVQTEMKNTSKLIETVAEKILSSILNRFSELHGVRVCIRKMNPPLNGEVGNSQITLSWTR